MTSPDEKTESKHAEHELQFLRGIADRLPEDAEVLKALGELYTQTGQYTDGLKVDERLSKLCSADPTVWYNLACSLALAARHDEAIEALTQALELGYDDYEWMKKDSDLASLRDDTRFASILDFVYNTYEQFPGY